MLLKPFYLVWNPARSGPARQHPTFEEAFKEAERLGKSQPQDSFVILKSISINKPVDKREWRDYAHYDELIGVSK